MDGETGWTGWTGACHQMRAVGRVRGNRRQTPPTELASRAHSGHLAGTKGTLQTEAKRQSLSPLFVAAAPGSQPQPGDGDTAAEPVQGLTPARV